MREKLTGLSLTFRLTEAQSATVERAMRVEKTSNVSEFVRRTLLVQCERILEEHELTLLRRAQLRAEIEQADAHPPLGLVAEVPATNDTTPAPPPKKTGQPGPVPRPRAAG